MSDGVSTVQVSETPQDARLMALRAKIGWICRAIDIGAVLTILWAVANNYDVLSDRAETVQRWAKIYSFDPSSVTESGYRSAFTVYVCLWMVIAALILAISRLMRGYLRGEVFSVAAAARMRRVGFAGLAVVAADILSRPLYIGLISTSLFSKMPLYSWIAPFDLLLLLFAGFVLALATIFKTAAAIALDHRQFV
jgi:hypothetical protein